MGSTVAGMFQISKIQSRKRQENSDPKNRGGFKADCDAEQQNTHVPSSWLRRDDYTP